jgi:hypothetical protein
MDSIFKPGDHCSLTPSSFQAIKYHFFLVGSIKVARRTTARYSDKKMR